MSGEFKSYRLNEPMKWAEFKAMPVDVQIMYYEALKQKYNPSDSTLAKMFEVCSLTVCNWKKAVGLPMSGKRSSREKWDEEGFNAWCYGIPAADVCQIADEEDETISAEVEQEVFEDEASTSDDETSIEEFCLVPDTVMKKLCEEVDKDSTNVLAIPQSGSLTFTGNAVTILNTLGHLLSFKKVQLTVNWDVVED